MIVKITATVPPPIATFLLTSEQSPDAIIAQQRRCRTNTIQLCQHLPVSVYPRLRDALPGIALVQVVHVTDTASVDYAVRRVGTRGRSVAGLRQSESER
jgi:phosphoribosylanthranilate isomerase